jgi:hypothetical protein
MLVALCVYAEAQPTKVPRIGFLGTSPTAIAARTEAFRQGLRELGYVEGKNIVIEWRFAEGKLDRLPALAAELGRLKADIIVSTGPTVTRAAKEATSRFPSSWLRITIPAPAERAAAPPTDHASAQGDTPRMSWARLLKRVFDIDVEHCPNCGGALKIIAAIEDPPVIIKILSHLGLPTRAPPRAPARRVDLFQIIWAAENRLPTQADGAARPGGELGVKSGVT